MRENLKRILKSLGFTELETRIFIKLLEFEEVTASRLGKELKIHRRSVYDAIERLVKKGLVVYIKKENKKYYKVIPEKILDLIKEKKEKIKEIEESYLAIKDKLSFRKAYVDAKILYGKEGIKRVFLEELEEGKEVYILCTDIKRTEELLGRIFLNKFTSKRLKKKIWLHILTSKKSEKYLRKYRLIKVKYLPFKFMSLSSFVAYGKKLNIILWSHEPTVISIENEEVAKSFKEFFDSLWKLTENIEKKELEVK